MPRLLGAKIRHIRQQQHLTQVELAQRLGLASHAHLNNLEAGRRAASLDLIVRVAHILRTSTDYLLRDVVALEPSPPAGVAPALSWQQHFKTALVRLREQGQMSQSQLAHSLGLSSQAYISNLEIGRKVPSPELLVQLADLFGVTTDMLLNGDTHAGPRDRWQQG